MNTNQYETIILMALIIKIVLIVIRETTLVALSLFSLSPFLQRSAQMLHLLIAEPTIGRSSTGLAGNFIAPVARRHLVNVAKSKPALTSSLNLSELPVAEVASSDASIAYIPLTEPSRAKPNKTKQNDSKLSQVNGRICFSR